MPLLICPGRRHMADAEGACSSRGAKSDSFIWLWAGRHQSRDSRSSCMKAISTPVILLDARTFSVRNFRSSRPARVDTVLQMKLKLPMKSGWLPITGLKLSLFWATQYYQEICPFGCSTLCSNRGCILLWAMRKDDCPAVFISEVPVML